MPRRIPLPSYARKHGSPVHPFPYQISTRALGLLQGATFYPAFVDAAVGLYRDSTKDSMDQLRQVFIANGMPQTTWDLSTDSLAKYLEYLPSPVMQAAVVEGLSHWDWYVGKLGRFIAFARLHGPKPNLTKGFESNLNVIPLCPFSEQIPILNEASGNTLGITASTVDSVNEMVLVRNLGIHSQWEVTSQYLKSTKKIGWSLGDVREVEVSEVEAWRAALYELISNTSSHFAEMYAKAPDFDPYNESLRTCHRIPHRSDRPVFRSGPRIVHRSQVRKTAKNHAGQAVGCQTSKESIKHV